MAYRRPVYVCPGCKTKIPFGTETDPQPTRCPGCDRRLWIPTVLKLESLMDMVCPACSATFKVVFLWNGQQQHQFVCPKCGGAVNPPSDPLPSAS